MEISAQRTPEADVGPRLAAGRDGVVHVAGDGRVLRRMAPDRDQLVEAHAMEHARSLGYPVPEVFRVGPGEIEMERIDGPTMLYDLSRRPWHAASHGRLLARLHDDLHRLAAPADVGLPAPFGSGERGDVSLLHLDLHPGNVMLSPDGPVVIDWTNAALGPGPADDADTWILLAAAVPDLSWWERIVVPPVRRMLTRAYVNGIDGRATRQHLGSAAERRAGDPNLRPEEIAAIKRFVAAETARSDSPPSSARAS
ncbi:MAG: phosphotransferase [Actinomycetota bacterium]|nr:phosphotransferase [Actinomycetota bacterium]